MERKPKRRTRERILETSLRLFNDFGEPNVTTSVIADEMNISPGNLYYHFRNKDEIITELFAEFEREIEEVLAAPTQRKSDIEDIWLFLHVVFELIWKYRFLYRDLNDLLSRNRVVETHFKRILDHSTATALRISEDLLAAGEMRGTRAELQAMATNMVVLATYWLSYEYVRNPRKAIDAQAFGRGVFQVMAMVAPYLQGNSRELFEKLAHEYLNS